MAKLKTRKSAAKRFKRTGSGRYKRSCANTSHLMGHKTSKQKMHLRAGGMVSKSDEGRLKKMLPG
ncbi:50S ribosomal protein L35 [Pasteuria penetrans]|uniref:50S ribosomal protein L35 n=1 Tax=Pasteuria penetrans TaxID=86005 RepID=UPI0011EEB468|nr:50S ribosomal protein L35 [Pasteuria penetrans]